MYLEVHNVTLWRYSLVGKDTRLSKWAIYLTQVRFPKADFGHLGHEGKRNAAWGAQTAHFIGGNWRLYLEVHIATLWRYSLVGKDTRLLKWAINLGLVFFSG